MYKINYLRVYFTIISAGFTLLELLVVLAIIALLGAVTGPQIITQLGAARSDTARLQIEELGAALDLYYLDTGRYPTTREGLETLIQPQAGDSRWNGPYLKKRRIPFDPWGNPYRFESPGVHGPYDLYSRGADNITGGEQENADILGWE